MPRVPHEFVTQSSERTGELNCRVLGSRDSRLDGLKICFQPWGYDIHRLDQSFELSLLVCGLDCIGYPVEVVSVQFSSSVG
jgi:hypothetical protein